MSRPAVLFGALLLALAPLAGAADGKVEYTAVGYASLDPARARTANDERLVLALFECLTVLDPATGRAAPGAAERWVEGADGRSWTFHLRADAVWSDGKPVRAADFAWAWRRALDPETGSPGGALFRPIRGGAEARDAAAASRLLDALSTGLRELAEKNPQGIPGDDLSSLVTECGARALASRIDEASVRRLLGWGKDPFPVETANQARDAVRAEKRRHRDAMDKVLEEFGKTTGAIAKDDRTLVVETDGWRPYLPELLARAVFAPLRQDVLEEKRLEAFEPADIVTNGPFRLKARGARPHAGAPNPLSVVHLERSAKYAGARPAASEEVLCWTDLGGHDELVRFGEGSVSWIPRVSPSLREQVEKNPALATLPPRSTWVLAIRCDRKPFDRPEVRRALALTVDRAVLAKRLWPAPDLADRLIPPGVRGLQPGPAAPRSDAAAAKKSFDAAKVKTDDVPWLELFHADDPDVQKLAADLVKSWSKVLGLEGGPAADTGDEAAKVHGGYYPVMLLEVRGGWDDPSAFLEPFRSGSADSPLGWRDEAFDAFVDGARDPDAAAAAPDRILGFASDKAGLKPKLDAAKAKTAPAREALRSALLVEAERRILDQCAVVPIVFPKRAFLLKGVTGLGEAAAWKNPAFEGSLRSAKR